MGSGTVKVNNFFASEYVKTNKFIETDGDYAKKT